MNDIASLERQKREIIISHLKLYHSADLSYSEIEQIEKINDEIERLKEMGCEANDGERSNYH